MAPRYDESFWIPHPEQVWIPATFKGSAADKAIFADGEGNEVQCPLAQANDFQGVLPEQLHGVHNICSLQEISRAIVLHNIRVRFLKPTPKVYTAVAQIIVAVNPFQMLPLYSLATTREYMNVRDISDLEPHIFSVGHCAVREVRLHGDRNQAVLISGESGAGKTESTKLILSYVSEALPADDEINDVKDKIMSTSPILESFGNSMTVRNNNSSRFGKWLQLSISRKSQRCALSGGRLSDYILELIRVSQQSKGERNYHVFFQITAKKDCFEGKLKLGDASCYRYLNQGQPKAPGIDDLEWFEEHRAALSKFGMGDEQQLEIFRVCAGILHLGNADFEAIDSSAEGHCKLKDRKPVLDASEVFGVDAFKLEECLVKKLIVVVKETTVTGRTPEQAEAARDSVSRLLYGKLFKYLLKKINSGLGNSEEADDQKGQFIGILDIAGFEQFERNSLEQLFINLSNEHLQAHFNNYVFKMELSDMAAEGIPATNISYKDNLDIIELLDSKKSVLAFLDEEMTVPKGSDAGFLAKVMKKFVEHPRLIKTKITSNKAFTIDHFAGVVEYEVKGFLEKNANQPPFEIIEVLKASNYSLLKGIGEDLDQESGKKKKAKTVGASFRAQLSLLMGRIGSAEPHFIRCIKPNSQKVPSKFEAKMVMDQLNCSGVFEAVRIRQSGFAVRQPIREFINRFIVILPRELQISGDRLGDKEAMELMLTRLPHALECVGQYQVGDIVIGKTKVFCRTRAALLLDKARDFSLFEVAIRIQRIYRGYAGRKRVREARLLVKELNEWHAKNLYYESSGPEFTAYHKLRTVEAIQEQLDKVTPLIARTKVSTFNIAKATEISPSVRTMKMEVEILNELKNLSTSLEPMSIDTGISRAKEFHLLVPTLATLENRLAKLKVQLPLYEALQNAFIVDTTIVEEPELDLENYDEILAELAKVSLDEKPQSWLPEIAAASALVLKLKTEATALREKIKEVERKAQEAKVTKISTNKSQGRRKTKRSTITGMNMDDERKILLKMVAAMETFDAKTLGDIVNHAIKQGIANKEVMEKAKTLCTNLSREEFVMAQMKEIMEWERIGAGDSATNFKCLVNLSSQATKLRIENPVVDNLREVVRSKCRNQIRQIVAGKSAAELLNHADLDVAFRAFSDLSHYPNLKNPDAWSGHKLRWKFGTAQRGADVMLKHCADPVEESLTMMNNEMGSRATHANHCILGWMHDRVATEMTKRTLIHDITTIAGSEVLLANEIYIQVMKQLTENPSPRSVSAGWKLMLSLVQSEVPSDAIREHVHAFVWDAYKKQANIEDHSLVAQCLNDIHKIGAASDTPRGNAIPATVILMDESQRKLRVSPTTTVRQFGEIVREQVGVKKEGDWLLCQRTDGMNAWRLIPQDVTVKTTLKMWESYKEKTGKSCVFLLRKRSLSRGETLDPGNPIDAMLSYRQAYTDYIHYPISENPHTLTDVAVQILYLEREHFRNAIKQISDGDLTGKSVLEQLLPERSLVRKSRKQLSDEILEAYAKYPSETNLVVMGRCYQAFQRMKLFGASWWIGKQIEDVEESKVSISDEKFGMARNQWTNARKLKQLPPMLTAHCKLTEAKKQEFVLAVDYWGIRFFATNIRPDEGGLLASRGFVFNEDTWDRILFWGAKSNVVQLIVAVVNPNAPKLGRIPMRINFRTAAAADIVYALHTMYACRCNESWA